MLDLKYPAARGKYDNWDALETLWRHTLHDELRLDPDEPFDALLSDTPIHYMQNRPRMGTTFFETFGANRLQISGEPKLNLFAAGRTTGISVDMGHSGVCVSDCAVFVSLVAVVIGLECSQTDH